MRVAVKELVYILQLNTTNNTTNTNRLSSPQVVEVTRDIRERAIVWSEFFLVFGFFFGLLNPSISASIDLHYAQLEVTHLVGSDRKW